MMRYRFVIPTLYFFSTLSLFPEANNLNDVPQNDGEKKAFLTPAKEKKSRFIFKNTSKTKDIDTKNESTQKNESQRYVYENKSKFKFQFTPGSGYNNIESSGASGSLGSGKGKGKRR